MSDTEQPALPRAGAQAPRRGAALAVIALLVALGVGASTYYWARFVAEPGTAGLRAQLEDVSAARDALDRRLADSEQRLYKLEAAQSASTSTLEALRNDTQALDQAVKSLAAKGDDTTLSWVLAECEYLVLAASQRLALEQDVTTAQAALSAADERLRHINHPAVTTLRAQLASDLQALAAVAAPDIAGLSLKFAAQIRKAGALHTKPIAALDTSFSHSRQERVTADNWRGVLRAMWDDLMSLVEIKDGELPDGELFDAKQRYYVEQDLKLELSSARLAILQRDTTNFRAAVEIVQEALARYYDANDAGVRALAQLLSEVRNIDLAPALPNVTASLDAVRVARQAVAVAGVPAHSATEAITAPPPQ